MKLKNIVFPLVIVAIIMFAMGVAVPRAIYIASHPDAPPIPTSAPSVLGTAATTTIVTSVSSPMGLRAIVPSTKSAFVRLKDGTVRVTFQFKPEDAAAAASLAQKRGEILYLSVTRGK